MARDVPPPDDAVIPSEQLLTFRLGRRVLRRDVGRVASLAAGLLAGTEYLGARRLSMFRELVETLCDDLAGEVFFEEELVWPALEQHAPGALPYAELRAEQKTLRYLVDDARRATRAVVADLDERPAALASTDDHQRVRLHAEVWRRLHEQLERFLDATEEDVVRLVRSRVPSQEWAAVLDRVRRGLPDRRGAGARLLEVASAEEFSPLVRQLGSRPIAGWRSQGRRRRADEALVFGAAVVAPRDPV